MSPIPQFNFKIDYELNGQRHATDVEASTESQAKQLVSAGHPGAIVTWCEKADIVPMGSLVRGQVVVLPDGRVGRIVMVSLSRATIRVRNTKKDVKIKDRTVQFGGSQEIDVSPSADGYGRPTAEQIAALETAEQENDMKRGKKVKKEKTAKVPVDCLCGCGKTTGGGKFLPGHDAKLKSQLVKQCYDGRTREKATATLREMGWAKYIPSENKINKAVKNGKKKNGKKADAETAAAEPNAETQTA